MEQNDNTEVVEKTFREKFIYEVKEWTKSIVFALILAFILKATVVQSYEIPTGSMKPTIMPFDRVLGNRVVYHLRDPKCGEVITFIPPKTVPQTERNFFGGVIPFAKRVIATGGDTVEVKDGKVYVNNVALEEPYINSTPSYTYALRVVPENMLFVLGDNRNNSNDSHVWHFVSTDNVQAKAFFRYWPPSRIGIVR